MAWDWDRHVYECGCVVEHGSDDWGQHDTRLVKACKSCNLARKLHKKRGKSLIDCYEDVIRDEYEHKFRERAEKLPDNLVPIKFYYQSMLNKRFSSYDDIPDTHKRKFKIECKDNIYYCCKSKIMLHKILTREMDAEIAESRNKFANDKQWVQENLSPSEWYVGKSNPHPNPMRGSKGF